MEFPFVFDFFFIGLSMGAACFCLNFLQFGPVSFHHLGQKVQLTVLFPLCENEMIFLKDAEMMPDGRVIEVEQLRQLLRVPGLLLDRLQDLETRSRSGTAGEKPPEQALKRIHG
jgi:hypothetical protein